MLKRVPTGVRVLDKALGGGLPRGSLTLLNGNPGTGKSIFSAQFLHSGVTKHKENGVYVSLTEVKEMFFEYMLGFGWRFDQLQKEGMFKFLDQTTAREIPASRAIDTIMEEVNALDAKRLVVDFTALAHAFRQQIDASEVLRVFLSKVIRQSGCTTLMLVKLPMNGHIVGTDSGEFVADGVITLKRVKGWDGGLLRELEISKMRGTMLSQSRYFFTMHRGFQVLDRFTAKTPQRVEKWKPIPDIETRFSTGSRDLDRVLGGGYPKGSYVILEADANVPRDAVRLFTRPLIFNFLSLGRGVAVIPFAGDNSETLKQSYIRHIDEATFNTYVRIYEEAQLWKNSEEPCRVFASGKNTEKDAVWHDAEMKLRESTGKPILKVIGYDRLDSNFANETQKLLMQAERYYLENTTYGNLTLALVRPKLSITEKLLNLVDWHLRLTARYGTIFFYGVKPRTGLYAVDSEVSKGYPTLKLTPVT